MSTSVRCPVCIGSSIQCDRCTIKQLKNEIKLLNQQLANYTEHISSDVLRVPYNEIHRIKQSNLPLDNYYPIDHDQLSSYKFITITFDPTKFGTQQLDQQRKDYILHHLIKLYDNEMIKNFYGCFEYHKNGIVHSHIIAQTYVPQDVYSYLKTKFTDNAKNKYAIQIDPAKIPQAIDYINKESTNYFIKISKKTYRKIITKMIDETESDEDNPLDVINNNINNY